MWDTYYETNDLGGDQHNYCRDPGGRNGGTLWCPTSVFSFSGDPDSYYYYDEGSWEACDALGAAGGASLLQLTDSNHDAEEEDVSLLKLDTKRSCKAFLDYERRTNQTEKRSLADPANNAAAANTHVEQQISVPHEEAELVVHEVVGIPEALVPEMAETVAS